MFLLQTKKEIFTKLPLFILACFVLAFSPFIISYIGGFISKLITGIECLDEGHCFWAVIPWFCFLTVPAAGLLLALITIFSIIDIISLFWKKPHA